MIINYDSNPNNSIYYMAAILYKYIIDISNDFENVYSFFVKNINKNQLVFFLSLDFLFLINKINIIKEGKIL